MINPYINDVNEHVLRREYSALKAEGKQTGMFVLVRGYRQGLNEKYKRKGSLVDGTAAKHNVIIPERGTLYLLEHFYESSTVQKLMDEGLIDYLFIDSTAPGEHDILNTWYDTLGYGDRIREGIGGSSRVDGSWYIEERGSITFPIITSTQKHIRKTPIQLQNEEVKRLLGFETISARDERRMLEGCMLAAYISSEMNDTEFAEAATKVLGFKVTRNHVVARRHHLNMQANVPRGRPIIGGCQCTDASLCRCSY